ncbi:MAG: hypothetical protein ACRCV3_01755 [Desulfovibrionaceae bacterium]
MARKKRHRNAIISISDDEAQNLFEEYVEKENSENSSEMLFLHSLSDVKILLKKIFVSRIKNVLYLFLNTIEKVFHFIVKMASLSLKVLHHLYRWL